MSMQSVHDLLERSGKFLAAFAVAAFTLSVSSFIYTTHEKDKLEAALSDLSERLAVLEAEIVHKTLKIEEMIRSNNGVMVIEMAHQVQRIDGLHSRFEKLENFTIYHKQAEVGTKPTLSPDTGTLVKPSLK